ncbi:MAG: translocation/assembly module TamB domain-containing protein [Lewinellaceae bacterium]|nr:translocation/assembly module TamB domain-containing protein [Lewinellaceae bacterium]
MEERTDQTPPTEPAEVPGTSRGWLRTAWRFIRFATAGFFLLFFLLYLLIQLPPIQRWTIRQITNSLSNTLTTPVKLATFRIGFFNRLKLGGLYIEDLQQDTLLYCDQLTAAINLNPITIYRQGLVVQDLSLVDARFEIRKLKGQEQTNLEWALKRLFPPKIPPPEKKKPFQLSIGELDLERVSFIQEDQVRGKIMRIELASGQAAIQEMDLVGRRLNISHFALSQPSFYLESLPDGIIPSDSLETPPTDSLTPLWRIQVDDFTLQQGSLTLENNRPLPPREPAPEAIDFRHLAVRDIQMDIRNFLYENESFFGEVQRISLKESSGFILNKLAAKEVVVNSGGVVLNGMELITPQTQLGDTLRLRFDQYADFGDFPEKVYMDARIRDSQVSLRDIMAFARGLNSNPFFVKNREEKVRIEGRVSGRVNNLRARDLNIQLSDGSVLEGSFSSRNLAVKNEESLNMRLSRLRTRVSTLRELIPNFRPPANFDRLGTLDFSGSFDGFLVDFVAYGSLRTNIGQAQMDIRMNTKAGRSQANYSGKLKLVDFDLGKWSGNANLGKISLTTQIKDGQGLSGPTAQANLDANIEKFSFKGYSYENARLQGELKANRFDGNFAIRDDNIDFSFAGQVDLSNQEIPVYDFKAAINHLDLRQLNLSKDSLILSGLVELNLRNKRLSDIEGTANFRDIILQRGAQSYFLDSMEVDSRFDPLGKKRLTIASDIITAELYGAFDIERVPTALQLYIKQYYPAFAHRLKINPRDTTIRLYNFDFSILVKDSKGWENLIGKNIGPFQEINFSGTFNNQAGILKANAQAAELKLGKVRLEDIIVLMDVKGSEGDLDLAVQSTTINDKQQFAPVSILTLLDRDTVSFGVTYSDDDPGALVNRFELDGRLFVFDSTRMGLQMGYNQLKFQEEAWTINRNNFVLFNRDSIIIRDFVLTQDERAIALESKGKRGVQLSMLNFDIGLLNEVINFPPIDFQGRINAFAASDDIFQLQNITVGVLSDTLRLNGDDWGILRINGNMKDKDHPITAYVSITRDASQLVLEGFYNLKDYGANLERRKGYFDAQLNIYSFPISIAEYFIGDVLSETHGTFDADLHFDGQFSRPTTRGKVYLGPGGVTVNYLKTHYTFRRATVNVDDNLFDMTGAVLRDKFNHTAILAGGIKHDHLKRFGFAARLNARRFLAMDTKKGDNKLFYGQALGTGEVVFSGSFKLPDIYVNASVSDSTRLVIPVSSQREADELKFLRFVDKRKEKEADESSPVTINQPKGVNLEMDLTVNLGAVLQIVFNEQAGDILEGTGRGALRITVPRQETFQMFGDIVIDQGDYLFTLYNVVNKNFQIKKGGTLTWTGDPFGALINLEAEYRDINTSVANFIQEYLVNASPDIKREATQNTNVELILQLSGDLLKPNIAFDLRMPNLQGELQSYVDGKLRVLKQDQNELNKQVFGLIVVGQFLPSDFALQGTDIIYNTVSEFVSNQLSLLLTELFSEFIGEGRVISGIDFDIAYSQYQNANVTGTDLRSGNELQVSLRQNFFNDRLSVVVGGNIDNNILADANDVATFVGNDLVIEYVLSKDRSLTLRIFQKLQPDISGRRLQIGTGLSFRREFDSFSDFLRSFTGKGKRGK